MKILLVSLGCDKNLVDSEVMLGMLAEKGYTFTNDEAEAEIAVVNTCCFINDAKEESVNAILEMAELKKSGQLKALIVTGCLAQRYQKEIREEIEEVDAIIGTSAIDKIAETIEDAIAGESREHMLPLDGKLSGNRKRMVTTGGHYAYLKIAEGCDKCCTYCIIPAIRGEYRSVPMEELTAEAETLAAGGVKELILVAQETTLYGLDLYGEKKLPELLSRLCRIPGLYWIRILYCYPEEITDDLIRVIKQEEKICHYLDIPVQHGSDSVLKRMGRKTDSEQIRNMVKKLRENIPDICLRTTLITGFPGETEKDHETLMEFVDEMEFDRLGVFTYSPEEGTPASLMPDQVGEDVKEKRRDAIMELQQEIAYEAAAKMEGKSVDAMIEGKIADEDAYVARTYKDAPNVDGYLFIHTDRQLMSGDFVKVRITGSYEYDLIGEICDEFTE
ncbi:MAG: 30S ribosomal protein S12 methylthiotransferase RimO [Kineothrix sp.]|jgi:ribosomal protein S12 methylthiotransferase|nr:30S ribosomal protein S12 methylthiotransferase RimO [Lachnospiraceae bacterium]MCX4344442.1 30S ribosomal protein S12 methylthiotransferase RimO [Kineothrix sp.]